MSAFGPPSVLRFPSKGSEGSDRLHEAHGENFGRIWRCLRRLGLTAAEADDTAQQVFVTFARKLSGIRRGAERAYLYRTATRMAADVRRTAARRYEVSDEDHEHEAPDFAPDVLMAERDARAVLDAVLDAMPSPLREIFVLYEIEELTMLEISGALKMPAGTVASRLRRAREEFSKLSAEHRSERPMPKVMP